MRKVAFLFFACIMAFVSCQETLNSIDDSLPSSDSESMDYAPEDVGFSKIKTDTLTISKEDALKIVEPITSKYSDRWVDISNEVIPADSEIPYNFLGQRMEVDDLSYFTSPDFDSWLVVIGFDPTYLGEQKLLHIFVNIESGEISEQWVDGRAIVEWDTTRNVYYYDDNLPVIVDNDFSFPIRRSHAPVKWAVIISGGSCLENNYSCFYNDTKRLYNTLVGTLGYLSGAVFCLMSDGNSPELDMRVSPSEYKNSNTDFDMDGKSDVSFEAKKARISVVFNLLHSLVLPGDEVLVCLVGHGSLSGGGFCLWDNEVLSPTELDAELDKLDPLAMVDVVLEQCYSGQFISSINDSNRSITASSSADETSSAFFYGESAMCIFLHRWINSISIYDNENTNDGYVAPLELFYSAKDSLATVSGCTEHPQFVSTPQHFGSKHTLRGEIIPTISGSNYLSTNSCCVFHIENNPDPSSVIWSAGRNTNLISYTDSTAIYRGMINDPLQFCSTNTQISAYMVVDGKNHKIIKFIDSVWKPGYYVNGNHIWGSNGVYHVRYYGGEYGYEWYSDNPDWQIIGYFTSTVNVLEGQTNNPVNLVACFCDPLGGQIFVMDRVN